MSYLWTRDPLHRGCMSYFWTQDPEISYTPKVAKQVTRDRPMRNRFQSSFHGARLVNRFQSSLTQFEFDIRASKQPFSLYTTVQADPCTPNQTSLQLIDRHGRWAHRPGGSIGESAASRSPAERKAGPGPGRQHSTPPSTEQNDEPLCPCGCIAQEQNWLRPEMMGLLQNASRCLECSFYFLALFCFPYQVPTMVCINM